MPREEIPRLWGTKSDRICSNLPSACTRMVTGSRGIQGLCPKGSLCSTRGQKVVQDLLQRAGWFPRDGCQLGRLNCSRRNRVRADQAKGECTNGRRKADVTDPRDAEHPISNASNTAQCVSGAIGARYHLQAPSFSCAAGISVLGPVGVRVGPLQMDKTPAIRKAHAHLPRGFCHES
jgi:hypothetical protein